MSAHFTTPTDELLLLAETLGEVKTKADKLEAEFATQARPLEAATNALSAAISGIKALQFHVLDNNLGALSARVEEMRKAVDEQVGVIALELKKADETNAAKAGQEADALRSEIAALQAQLGTLGAQFSAQLERVEFSAKEEAKKLQLIPGPAGAAGASLNPRGTFIDGETYNRLDVVSWLGSSYIAAVDGVTEKPSKNSNQWQVLASRGGGAAGGAGDFGSLAGVAQINQGGTGQTTRAAGLNALLPSQTGNVQYMLLTDGAGTVSWGAQPVAGLPSQTSNGGKLLTTDGTNASWSNAVTVSGSNATVTGTLTVNTSGSVFNTRLFINSAARNQTLTDGTAITGSNSADDLALRNDSGKIYLSAGGAVPQFTLTTTALTLSSTTASTTTSSGALVVSGGLGVGGALNVGGQIRAQLGLFAGSPPTGLASAYQVDVDAGTSRDILSWGDSSRVGLIRGEQDGSGRATLKFGRYTASTFAEYFRVTGLAATDAIVNIYGTTASTSTSSGALVVSGGVGVAKSVTVGENIDIGTGHGTKLYVNNSGAWASKELLVTGYDTLDYTQIKVVGNASNTASIKLDQNGLATISGAVRTAAPSGGTAANWKLGTVASVSPTSPNRTIEVDIGGTIYYIHAKTTNN